MKIKLYKNTFNIIKTMYTSMFESRGYKCNETIGNINYNALRLKE